MSREGSGDEKFVSAGHSRSPSLDLSTSQLPVSFTLSGEPQDVLFPPKSPSDPLQDAGVAQKQHVPPEEETEHTLYVDHNKPAEQTIAIDSVISSQHKSRQASNISPRPPNTLVCSLVSNGRPAECDHCLTPTRQGLTSSTVSLAGSRNAPSLTGSVEAERPTSTHSNSETNVTAAGHSRLRDIFHPLHSKTDTALEDYTSPDFIEQVVTKVRDHLSSLRQPDPSGLYQNKSGIQNNVGQDKYLVDERYLKEVVDMVERELDYFKQTVARVVHSHPPDKCVPDQPKYTLRKPSCLTNSIEPQASTIAEPATTISVPQTAVFSRNSKDGQVCTEIRSHPPTTTILSQKSVTSIRWPSKSPVTAEYGPPEHTPELSPLAVSESQSRRDSFSSCAHSAKDTPPSSFRGFTMEPGFSGKKARKENTPRGIAFANHVLFESFPALSPRQNATDWLRPPSSFLVAPPSQKRDDMYHLGIDARSGNPVPVPSVLVEEPIKARHCSHGMFHEGIFEEDDRDKEDSVTGASTGTGNRRATEASITTSSLGSHRLGTPIGTGSHRRRNTIVENSSNPLLRIHQHKPGTPHFLDRIRAGGKLISRKLSAVFQGPLTGGIRAPEPSAASGDLGVDSQDGGSRPMSAQPLGVEHLDPLLLYAVEDVMERSRRDTCSEDHEPHACENDRSPRMSPEPVVV